MKLAFFSPVARWAGRSLAWKSLAFAAMNLAVFAPSTFAEEVSTKRPATAEDAQAEDEVIERLRDTLRYLASDEREGRGVGTDGLQQAGDYISQHFDDWGLELPPGLETRFQPFEIKLASKMGPDDQNNLHFEIADEKNIDGTLNETFRPLLIGGSNKFNAPVIFAGYGITAPNLEYDDYADIDVKGKIVIILRKEPQQENEDSVFDGTKASRFAQFSQKVSNAFRHEAAGVILVNDSISLKEEKQGLERELKAAVDSLKKLTEEFEAKENPSDDDRERYLKGSERLARRVADTANKLQGDLDQLLDAGRAGSRTEHTTFPVLFAKRSFVDSILKQQMGKTLLDLEHEIDEDLKPASAEVEGLTAVGESKVLIKEATARNVIGLIDAPNAVSDEIIVIGAHYDHLGNGEYGSLAPLTREIHNGADDNASGTTAMLEIAKRLSENKDKLKHRVLVCAFSGEELGLLGSAHYVNHPVIPLEKTIAMVNFDMVGRLKDEQLTIMGAGAAAEFDEMLDKYNQKYHFILNKEKSGFGPSDHASFYGKEVPAMALFTGLHDDYHRPSDDWDRINYTDMARIIDYGIDLIHEIDQRAERLTYVSIKEHVRPTRQTARPYFGSMPDFSVTEGGYGIQATTAGSPADVAGIKAGDILIRLGKSKIGGLEDFDAALREYSAGDKVTAIVKRGDKEVELEVVLGTPR